MYNNWFMVSIDNFGKFNLYFVVKNETEFRKKNDDNRQNVKRQQWQENVFVKTF